MNKARRKKIERIVTTMKAFKEELEMLRDEEEQAYDNTPDSFKDCEKGERAEEIFIGRLCVHRHGRHSGNWSQKC